MRLVPALALAALLASPALAQTQYADSSGGFVSLNGLTFSNSDLQAVDGTLGYRFSSGVDLGMRYKTGSSGAGADFHQFGPVAGLTRPLGAGFSGRLEGTVQFSTYGGRQLTDLRGQVVEPFDVRIRDLSESVSAAVSRRVPLVGSLAIQPALGGYFAGRHRLTFQFPDFPFEQPRTQLQAGLQVEIPITFRLFGQDAALVTGGRIPLNLKSTGIEDATYAGGGFRLNF